MGNKIMPPPLVFDGEGFEGIDVLIENDILGIGLIVLKDDKHVLGWVCARIIASFQPILVINERRSAELLMAKNGLTANHATADDTPQFLFKTS